MRKSKKSKIYIIIIIISVIVIIAGILTWGFLSNWGSGQKNTMMNNPKPKEEEEKPKEEEEKPKKEEEKPKEEEKKPKEEEEKPKKEEEKPKEEEEKPKDEEKPKERVAELQIGVTKPKVKKIKEIRVQMETRDQGWGGNRCLLSIIVKR